MFIRFPWERGCGSTFYMIKLFSNADIVLPAAVIRGTLAVEDGHITDIQPDASHAAGAIDFGGDYLLPGAVDLHTDNLERQVEPRTGTRWPSRSALMAHDAHCAAAGITTVLDALCVGDLGFDEERSRTCTEAIQDLDEFVPTGLLKAQHFLHLRCELPAPGMVDLLSPLVGHKLLRVLSLMDHTPGSGQYADLARYRTMRLRDGDAPQAIEARIAVLQSRRERIRAPNRAALLALVRSRAPAVALAGHDDRTLQDVAENLADGIAIAEFPVTMEAACAAKAGGQAVIAGAPNLVRGGSHTGNVAAADLLKAASIMLAGT
jgi:alpha-D-ribose 1-methylphosphonate 5-triphosphate diphosphatase